jgi:hypothetical protein
MLAVRVTENVRAVQSSYYSSRPCRILPFNVLHLYFLSRVERVLLEVNVLKVGVHVEARAAKVIGARDVGHDALSAGADLIQAHPHVPVPHLERDG